MLKDSSRDLLNYLSKKGFPMNQTQEISKESSQRVVTKLSASCYKITNTQFEDTIIDDGGALLSAIQQSAKAMNMTLFK